MAKKRGIIIDDASIVRMRLHEILAEEYDIVAEGENGVDAIELYDQLRPDFMTLDITMAEMNGKDALRKLLSNDPKAMIIMVSAVGIRSNVMECIEVGARDFINKPFDGELVRKKLKKILA